MSIQNSMVANIVTGIKDFAIALYDGATDLTERVGKVALNILGESAKDFAKGILQDWTHLAIGGAVIIGGAALLAGIAIGVKKVVSHYFPAKKTAREAKKEAAAAKKEAAAAKKEEAAAKKEEAAAKKEEAAAAKKATV